MSSDHPSLEALRFEQARTVSEGEIDADLAIYGFQWDATYPEYGHTDLRQAWLAGRDDALIRAFRCLRITTSPPSATAPHDRPSTESEHMS